MATKRMFSRSVTDTDNFLDMPVSSRCLYFHLGMHGDDDGFVSSPRSIVRAVGCSLDDLRLLVSKGYLIQFDSGVVVITDWAVNNTLKNDRYHPTVYQAEKAMLSQNPSGRYELVSGGLVPARNQLGTGMEPGWNQSGTNLEPEWNQPGTRVEPEHNITEHNHNIAEPNIGITRTTGLIKPKESIGGCRGADKPPRSSRFSPPAVEDVRAYIKEQGYHVDAEAFVDYYSANGWVQGKGKPIKDWRAAVRTWERRNRENPGPAVRQQRTTGNPFLEMMRREEEEERRRGGG